MKKIALKLLIFLFAFLAIFSFSAQKKVFAKDPICPPECSTAGCVLGVGSCDPIYGGGACYQGLGGHRSTCPRPKEYCPPDGQNYYIFNTGTKKCDVLGNTATFLCLSGSCNTAIGNVPVDNLESFLTFALKFAFFASGGIIVLMIISTGYTIITSSGNPEKLQAAQENVIALFSGLALIAFSLVLLQALGAGILGLPGF